VRAWIVLAVLAFAPAARADSPDADTGESAEQPAPAEKKPAEEKPADATPATPPGEYDPIIDEARLDSAWQRAGELYDRAVAMLDNLTPPPAKR
jgi:hypothetical protein